MKTHLRNLLIALGTTGVIGGATLGSVIAYGKYSESAEGFKLETTNEHDFYWGQGYQMNFIDENGVTNVNVGEFKPGIGGNEGTVNGKPVSDFIKEYKKNHNNLTPTLTIKSGLFNFENRYLSAVSPDDWYKFVSWYIGDANHSGHLSFGPEAGQLRTFQIIPGVERKGNSVTLGGMASKNKEDQTITFYPDAFFGNLTSYSLDNGKFNNRLLNVALTKYNHFNGKEVTLDEAETFVSLINKVNEFNGQHKSWFENAFNNPNDLNHPNNPYHNPDSRRGSYTFNGENSPVPYYLMPLGKKYDSTLGRKVEKYKIFLQAYTSKDADADKRTLLEKLADEFPELTTHVKGKHFVKNAKGEFSIVDGEYDVILPEQTIGLAQVMKVIDPKFKGFGVDFLKYLGIHEYGHHQTLARAKDLSEGGVQIGSVTSKHQLSSPSNLYNMDVLNDYLAARSNGLQITKVNPITGARLSDSSSSIYSNFLINGHLETESDKIGKNPSNGHDGRAYHDDFESFKKEYSAAHANSALYNAFLMNSFDWVSGFINPELTLSPTIRQIDTHVSLNADGKKLFALLSNSSYSSVVNNAIDTAINATAGANGANIKLAFQDMLQSEHSFFKTYFASMIVPAYNALIEDALYGKEAQDQNGNQIHIDGVLDILLKEQIVTSADKSEITDILTKQKAHKKAKNTPFVIELVNLKGTPIPHISNAEHAFYDVETNSWVSFGEIIGKWKDAQGHKIFTTPKDPNHPDIDVHKIVVSMLAGPQGNKPDPEYAEDIADAEKKIISNSVDAKYDLVDIDNIKDKNGNSWGQTVLNFYVPKFIQAGYSQQKAIEEARKLGKQYFINDQIIPMIKAMRNTTEWGAPGPESSPVYDSNEPRPQTPGMIFSDYVFQYPEVLTRDFIQMTLAQEDTPLSNLKTVFLGLSQSQTSFEYFISGLITRKFAYNSQNLFTSGDSARWIGKGFADWDGILDTQRIAEYKTAISRVLNAKELAMWTEIDTFHNKMSLKNDDGMDKNPYFGKDRAMSNGFEQDRQQREALGWGLYNEDGSPRAISQSDKITITGPNGQAPTSWAEAYWFFMLKSNGIGDRALTGIFRTPQDDHEFMYGYLPNSYKTQVKYLAFRNQETGKIKYQKLHTDGISNMFYLTHQGDESSKHILENEGFFAWSTDKFTAGGFTNSFLKQGNYEIFFADANHNIINNIDFLGSRRNISENGKSETAAATGVHLVNGKAVLFVKEHFN